MASNDERRRGGGGHLVHANGQKEGANYSTSVALVIGEHEVWEREGEREMGPLVCCT